MANLADVGDSVELFVPDRGEQIDLAISGTYVMTLELQIELGSKGSGVWQRLRSYSGTNVTFADQYVTRSFGENIRIVVVADTSGTAVSTLVDNDDRTILDFKDDVKNTKATWRQSGVTFPNAVTVSGALTIDAATVMRGPASAPTITKWPVPTTSTTATDITEAFLLGGIHVKTPSAAQNFQVPTGTEISDAILAASGVAVAAGDTFDWSLINLGSTGDILTLIVDTGVTFVGSVTVDDPGADINSSGLFRFRNVSANVWVCYRVA